MTSPTDAHTLPTPPWVFARRIADMTNATGERWCATDGCQHMVEGIHRLCPCCSDRAVRGR